MDAVVPESHADAAASGRQVNPTSQWGLATRVRERRETGGICPPDSGGTNAIAGRAPRAGCPLATYATTSTRTVGTAGCASRATRACEGRSDSAQSSRADRLRLFAGTSEHGSTALTVFHAGT